MDEEIKKKRMDLVIGFTFEKYKILPLLSSILVALLAVSFSNIRELIKSLPLFRLSIGIFIALIPVSLLFFLKSFKFEEEDMIDKFERIAKDNRSNPIRPRGWKRMVLNSPKIILGIFTLATFLLVASFFVRDDFINTIIEKIISHLSNSVSNWLGLFNLIAVAYIGLQARLISKRQVDLEDYADVFVRPYKIPDTESWELQIRSACPRIIYLHKVVFEGEKAKKMFGDEILFSRGKLATLPAGEQNYYSILLKDSNQLDKDPNNVTTIHFDIEFYDVLSRKQRSHHVGWFQENRWAIHNLKSE